MVDRRLFGIWTDLTARFGLPGLANVLGATPFDVTAWATNRTGRIPPVEVAETLDTLCCVYQVRPVLYVQWEPHLGVMVSSVPTGWRAWSLDSAPGYTITTRWYGDPTTLIPADSETLERARQKGWPN